ncbi:MAG: three-Cys-motif partner protein TcmP [Snowella sp.]|nr:three-Cys-motif partner protein TcmP [Snowella sp.]
MSDNFFTEQKEQSLVKATIVEKYFVAWAKIMTSVVRDLPPDKQKIAYIDLFAGPGRYEDGSKSTPIKVLETAIKDSAISNMLITLFNDINRGNINSLQETINNINGINELKYKPLIMNEEVGENIVNQFEKMKLIPTLFFVDPWGYKGLSLRLINSVVRNWGCDCIFFFNYGRINAGLSNTAVKQHLDSLFGDVRADQLRINLEGLSPLERELLIVEAICQALQEEGGKFVLPFRFKNENGTRTKHHLIFVSKHIRGYSKMKDIMAKESSSDNQGVPSFEYSPASKKYPLLFELSRPLDNLEEMLLEDFSGQTITMEKLFEQHNIGKPYIRRNYVDTLNNLEESHKIEVRVAEDKKRRKAKGQFADHLIVVFPAKQ